MSAARDATLFAIRSVQPNQPDAQAVALEALRLLDSPDRVRPLLSAPNPIEAFAARVESRHVGATLLRIPSLSQLPQSIARYLHEQGVPLSIGLQPDPVLARLDWHGFVLEPLLQSNLSVGVGMARYGIAETGSLVFRSGSDTAVLGHIFPYRHIAVILASTILPYLDDYALLGSPMPRNLNLITGASGTTDIEGRLVLGAHGPRYLHIVLIEDSNESA